jgi:hypothetical protein
VPHDADEAPLCTFLQATDADTLAFRQNRLRPFVEPEIHDTFIAFDALGKKLHAQQSFSASRRTEQHRDRPGSYSTSEHRVQLAESERKLRSGCDTLLVDSFLRKPSFDPWSHLEPFIRYAQGVKTANGRAATQLQDADVPQRP